MPNSSPVPNTWRVVGPASGLVYLASLLLMGLLARDSAGSERLGWAVALGYAVLLGWPVALGLVVSLHLLVEWRFQHRAYTLGWACLCGPAAVALDLLLLGMVQACFHAKALYLEDQYQPPDPPGAAHWDAATVAQAAGGLLVAAVGLGLLLAIPHYVFFRRESRRA